MRSNLNNKKNSIILKNILPNLELKNEEIFLSLISNS